MQSEKFDIKIKEAAENHHPAYDEHAWEKMEKLLDKHLPQKKDDKRKGIFFLLLVLLLGSGAAFLYMNKGKQIENPVVQDNSRLKENVATYKPGTTTTAKTDQTSSLNITENKTLSIESKRENEKQQTSIGVNQIKISSGYKNQQKLNNNIKKSEPLLQTGYLPGENIITDNSRLNNVISNNEIVTKNNKENNAVSENIVINNVENDLKAVNESQQENKTIQQVNKNESADLVKPVGLKKEPGRKNTNSFFLSISAGPEVSGAEYGKTGGMHLTAGAGLGYNINDRFSLRTGFYSVHKVYTASPAEYHPPASFWNYYPNMQKIDADCKVYEIPLLVSYHFGKSSKHSWTGTAGLSSYLMKKESYNYTYKDQAGQMRTKNWTIYDENKHYFSVVTLAAGYQRNLNNNLFITAEPYLKMPMSGIGYGKINLNSAGILLSMGLKLFDASKKHGQASSH